MEEIKIINNKLDQLIAGVNEIKTKQAVEIVKREQLEAQMHEVKKTSEQYKSDRYKVIGASGIISTLIAWFTK